VGLGTSVGGCGFIFFTFLKILSLVEMISIKKICRQIMPGFKTGILCGDDLIFIKHLLLTQQVTMCPCS